MKRMILLSVTSLIVGFGETDTTAADTPTLAPAATHLAPSCSAEYVTSAASKVAVPLFLKAQRKYPTLYFYHTTLAGAEAQARATGEPESLIRMVRATIDGLTPLATIRSIRTIASNDKLKRSSCIGIAHFEFSNLDSLDNIEGAVDKRDDWIQGFKMGGFDLSRSYEEEIRYEAQITDAGDEVIVNVQMNEL